MQALATPMMLREMPLLRLKQIATQKKHLMRQLVVGLVVTQNIPWR
jgi:hypothetical protein